MTNSVFIDKRTIARVTIALAVIVTLCLLHLALTTQMWREFWLSIFDLYLTAAAVYFMITER